MEEEGVRLHAGWREEAAEKARELGISVEEAEQFYKQLVRGMVDDAFAEEREPTHELR